MFPAPLEVDRELYEGWGVVITKDGEELFPAPREVDRYLY